SDVVSLINEARDLINKHEKASGKRKVIIKKKRTEQDMDTGGHDDQYVREILNGAELSAIPVNASLTMYIAGFSSGDPGNAGIGIIIFDKEDRQVGKVCDFIGKRSNNVSEYVALIRALKLAEYFRVSELKLRTDYELIVKQINGESKVKNPEIKKYTDEVFELIKRIKSFRIEYIPGNLNDKA